MAGMWLGKTEASTVESMLPQLVDIAWRAVVAADGAGDTMSDWMAERADWEDRYGKLDEQVGRLAADLTNMEFRAIAAEQDALNWKAAYEVMCATANEELVLNDGKRPVDPFGKNGVYGGLGGTVSTSD